MHTKEITEQVQMLSMVIADKLFDPSSKRLMNLDRILDAAEAGESITSVPFSNGKAYVTLKELGLVP